MVSWHGNCIVLQGIWNLKGNLTSAFSPHLLLKKTKHPKQPTKNLMTIYLVFIFQALLSFSTPVSMVVLCFQFLPYLPLRRPLVEGEPGAGAWALFSYVFDEGTCMLGIRGFGRFPVKKSQGHGRTGSWFRDNLCYLLMMVRGMPQDDMIQPDVILFNSYYLHTYYIYQIQDYIMYCKNSKKKAWLGSAYLTSKVVFFSVYCSRFKQKC